jgi:hypothetical protein
VLGAQNVAFTLKSSVIRPGASTLGSGNGSPLAAGRRGPGADGQLGQNPQNPYLERTRSGSQGKAGLVPFADPALISTIFVAFDQAGAEYDGPFWPVYS